MSIPLYLHYQLTPQSTVAAARRLTGDAGVLEPITEIDVIYGGKEVRPLFGYERLPFITGGNDDPNKAVMSTGKGRFGSSLAIRRRPIGECFIDQVLIWSPIQFSNPPIHLYQTFLLLPPSSSLNKASLRSYKSQTCTSRLDPVCVVISTLRGSRNVNGWDPTTILSTG